MSDPVRQTYSLCADTIRREIAAAERSIPRLRAAGLSTAPDEHLVERLTRILHKFDVLAVGE
jgi:hypothetical protein